MIAFLVLFVLLFVNLKQQSEGNLNAILGVFALASIRLLPALSNTISNINNFKYNAFSIERLFSDFQEIEKFRRSREIYSNSKS